MHWLFENISGRGTRASLLGAHMETIAKTSLIGSEFTLTAEHLADWPADVPVNSTMSFTINGVDGAGLKKSDTEIYLIMGSSIAAPRGSCVSYTWMESAECGDDTAEDNCEATAVTNLTPGMKLAVLDDKGCPTGYVTLDDLMQFLTDNTEPVPLCDRVTASPDATTADMRVLTLKNGCDLASVPISAFDCIMSDPENFTCG